MELNEYLARRSQGDSEELRRQQDRQPGIALAKNLLRRRTQLELSQQELAKRVGTSQARIAGYESGAANPTIRTLAKISRVLEVRVSELLDEDPFLFDEGEFVTWMPHESSLAPPPARGAAWHGDKVVTGRIGGTEEWDEVHEDPEGPRGLALEA